MEYCDTLKNVQYTIRWKQGNINGLSMKSNDMVFIFHCFQNMRPTIGFIIMMIMTVATEIMMSSFYHFETNV